MPEKVTVTESLCPVCLEKIPARRVAVEDQVHLVKTCPAHGEWSTPIWRGPPDMEEWVGHGPDATCCGGPPQHIGAAPVTQGCPYDCGLCPDHGQSTCTAVLEVTSRCNMRCPICFADAGAAPSSDDPPAAQLRAQLRDLMVAAGPVNIQFSGGEPTVREDLPLLVAAARDIGFTFIQINSNGLRLGREPGYAQVLREAGAASVFLQFDGLGPAATEPIRGRVPLEEKLRAVEHCAQAGLAVVLVPTVVAGVNDRELGAIVRYAADMVPVVRGVHIQPISYFGRFPAGRQPRLTLPEVLRALEEQTGGQVKPAHFSPSSCEHVLCSFRGRYWVRSGGRLEPFAFHAVPADSSLQSDCAELGPVSSVSRRAVAATARQWSPPPARPGCSAEAADELERFLAGADRVLSISGMLFQDVWNLDLERVRRCCVHALVPGRGRVPFCLWNLTSASGRRLYRS